jgi:hypothetical protein
METVVHTSDQIRSSMSHTPLALWDARPTSALVLGSATPAGRLHLLLPTVTVWPGNGCLPVAVMVGEHARYRLGAASTRQLHRRPSIARRRLRGHIEDEVWGMLTGIDTQNARGRTYRRRQPAAG